MAQPPTIHRMHVALTDVDRGVYETLDLRVARHPSETIKYMLLRVLGYALSWDEGIAFSKEGLHNPDEPPLSVVDPTGLLTGWIEIGSPSADRLHKASKAARVVEVYTSADLTLLRKEMRSRVVHKLSEIAVWRFEPAFIAAVEEHVGRETKIELTRTEGSIYLSVAGQTLETQLVRHDLSAEPQS